MNNADAWGLDGVLDFFDTERSNTGQVYASEWFFLKDRMREGMRVLDVGCAQGGFASVLAEHLKDFRYTGIDINPAMIERARARHPGHTFQTITEDADWACLGDETFDLVLVLGILHLHEGWRRTIAQAWSHTAGCLLMDLRETEGPTIEDKARSYFRMDFGGKDERYASTTLPYVLINSAEALETVRRLTPGARRTSHYGYLHPASASASVPVDGVMTNVWCVER
ncbi:Putative methyltransferase (methylase) [Paramagnetospirillum caucaseum]|uniref:Putative methyltransferase (Methylase) n=1 Tax=Paramagnetospirillum caucaseum TaxID=1244869 RepID=M2YBY9_9PROT|nr:class I SAM-dependent methyltransferase [Paramagnetospirillum caucaseum]EME70521.1 Putative methyltransferase (methylase) [Paramagnetospirillum caucaseum]